MQSFSSNRCDGVNFNLFIFFLLLCFIYSFVEMNVWFAEEEQPKRMEKTNERTEKNGGAITIEQRFAKVHA